MIPGNIINWQSLLDFYAQGAFPMADSREARGFRLYQPKIRAILPLDPFHVPKNLAKLYRQEPFKIRINTAFQAVITACAEPRAERPDTWINDDIIGLYCDMHAHGHAHSVECWQDGTLVGGLYGVQIGGAFFGESMFSRTSNASKIALVALAERLNAQGFELLDAQYHNPHLEQFGLLEIPHAEYMERLETAMAKPCRFV